MCSSLTPPVQTVDRVGNYYVHMQNPSYKKQTLFLMWLVIESLMRVPSNPENVY